MSGQTREEIIMRLIGVLATVCVASAATVVAGMAVASLPDVKRYIRISRM
jgi:hypothetical protein